MKKTMHKVLAGLLSEVGAIANSSRYAAAVKTEAALTLEKLYGIKDGDGTCPVSACRSLVDLIERKATECRGLVWARCEMLKLLRTINPHFNMPANVDLPASWYGRGEKSTVFFRHLSSD